VDALCAGGLGEEGNIGITLASDLNKESFGLWHGSRDLGVGFGSARAAFVIDKEASSATPSRPTPKDLPNLKRSKHGSRVVAGAMWAEIGTRHQDHTMTNDPFTRSDFDAAQAGRYLAFLPALEKQASVRSRGCRVSIRIVLESCCGIAMASA